MIEKIIKVYRALNQLVQLNTTSRNRENDLLALTLMHNLIHAGKYLPFTQFSLSPYALAMIMNDVIVNQRRNILEFGSGISTILTARLIRTNQLDATITSVEHDAKWIQFIKSTLAEEGLLPYVTFVEAPLLERFSSQHSLPWYDTNILDMHLKGQYDLVLVDGPPSTEKLNRYPALPYLHKKLSDCFSFYLDDAHREGETLILKKWESEYGISFKTYEQMIALGSRGKVFESCLRAYW